MGMDLKWHGLYWEPTGYGTLTRECVVALYKLGANLALMNTSPLLSPVFEMPKIYSHVYVATKGRNVPPYAPCVTCWTAEKALLSVNGKNIIFTMLESDRIPDFWVKRLNMMDEIWVPSHFNLNTFVESGVYRDLIHVVNLGVNRQFYHPNIEPSIFDIDEPYLYLTVFEWATRKNADNLINGFMEVFHDVDDVVLLLIVNPGSSYQRKIFEFIKNLRRKTNSNAKIYVTWSVFNYDELASLYKRAYCYISLSRGEGWCLPANESMACGTPVIITGWSAPLEYVNEQNSFIVRVNNLIEAKTGDHFQIYYDNSYWADPDINHYKELLWLTYKNPNLVMEKGMRAAKDVEHLTWDNTAQTIIERLKYLNKANNQKKLFMVEQDIVESRVLHIVPSLKDRTCTLRNYFSWLFETNKMGDKSKAINIDGLSSIDLDDYNIVHFYFAYDFLNNVELRKLFRKLNNKLVIVEFHSVNAFEVITNNYLCQVADCIVVHSKEEQNLLYPFAQGKIEIVPLGVKVLNNLEPKKEFRDIKYLSIVKELNENEGLMSVVSKIQYLPNYDFTIYGVYKDKNYMFYKELLTLRDELNILNLNLDITNYDYPVLVEKLNNSDLIIFPNATSEFNPNVCKLIPLLLASYTPIIVWNIEGELYGFPNNLFMIVNTFEDLISVLEDKLNPSEYISLSNLMYEYVHTNSVYVIAEKYKLLYKKLLEGGMGK